MPVSTMDDNIYQSANWTRSPPGGRQPYQQLGGVSLLKAQNPTFLDDTNVNLTTRAIDRRVANPDPNLFAPTEDATQTTMPAESSNAEAAAIPVSTPKRRRRRSSTCRARDDDQAALNVCPSDRLSMRDFLSEMKDTCVDISLAVSKKPNPNEKRIDQVSSVIYKGKRPIYLGIVMLALLLILLLVATLPSSKK